MKTILAFVGLALTFITSSSSSQTLAESFKPQTWATYIFISSSMPRASLMELARDASRSKSTLVLKGFSRNKQTLEGAREFVSDINASCCGDRPPGWVIHPKLYEKFNVRSTPTFVMSKGLGSGPSDFVVVSGDMSLANALKFFAQGSTNKEMRDKATEIYKKTYLQD